MDTHAKCSYGLHMLNWIMTKTLIHYDNWQFLSHLLFHPNLYLMPKPSNKRPSPIQRHYRALGFDLLILNLSLTYTPYFAWLLILYFKNINLGDVCQKGIPVPSKMQEKSLLIPKMCTTNLGSLKWATVLSQPPKKRLIHTYVHAFLHVTMSKYKKFKS